MKYKTTVGNLVEHQSSPNNWVKQSIKASGATLSKWDIVSYDYYEGEDTRELILNIEGDYTELIKFIKYSHGWDTWTDEKVEQEYEFEKIK